jgi:hypothetical protein
MDELMEEQRDDANANISSMVASLSAGGSRRR